MKIFLLVLVLLLSACGEQKPELSYTQLLSYPKDCSKKNAMLAELLRTQEIKNFHPDPDQLNESDRQYNSRLKSTIWWYYIECNNEKTTVTLNSSQ